MTNKVIFKKRELLQKKRKKLFINNNMHLAIRYLDLQLARHRLKKY